MNTDQLEQAFVRGFLNKQAEVGLEKEAFLPGLFNVGLGVAGSLGGSVIGQQLLKKFIPALASSSRTKMVSRAAARNGGVIPKYIKDTQTGKVRLDAPASSNFLGRGYDSALNWLSKRKNSANLLDQSGMILGGTVGGLGVAPFMVGNE
jgi:hypothetical protein